MGARGPQRKPTELLNLAGSWRGKEREKTEPGVGYAIPDPPPGLTEAGLAAWPYAISLVEHLRCVTESDAMQLGILAESWAEYVACNLAIVSEGGTLFDDKGKKYTNPAVKQRDACYVRLKDSIDRFGLNPSNRSRVQELTAKIGEIVVIDVPKKSRYAD